MAAGKLVISYFDEKSDKAIIAVADYEYVFGFRRFQKSNIVNPVQRPKNFLFYFPLKIG